MKSLFALVVFLATFCTAVPAHAQRQEPPDEPRVDRSKPDLRRGPRVSGFGGLQPAEARAAQTLFDEAARLDEAGRYSSALRRYKRVYKKFPRSTAAPEAYVRSARILVRKDSYSKAFEMLDAVITAYPNYGHFNEIIAEQYRIAHALVNGHRSRIFGIIPGFAHPERGILYFERLVANAPYSDYAPLALINIAEARFRADEPEYAIDALDRLIANYPDSIVTSDAYLRLAQMHERLVFGSLYDQSSTREAMNNYEDFLILYPKEPNVAKAEDGLVRMREMLSQSRLRMADFYYLKRSRYQAAKVFYNEAITIAPKSAAAQTARERLAQVEVDEAKAAARLAADAEKSKKGVFDFLKPKSSGLAPPNAPGNPTAPAISTPPPARAEPAPASP